MSDRFAVPPDIAPSVRSMPGARRPDRSSWVSSGGLRVATYEWGDAGAPAILLAHGGFDFAGTFDVLAPMLVAGGWRVVSWDARGHGNSEHAVLYSWNGDVRDAKAVLDAVCQADLARTGSIEPVVFVGHSKGGGLVLDLAHAVPHRVSHLVNLDGLPSKNNWPDMADHERTKMLRGELEGWLDHRREVAEAERRPGTITALAERRARMNPRLTMDWLEYLVTIGAERVDQADGTGAPDVFEVVDDPDGLWRWKLDPGLRFGGFGPWRPEWSMQRLPGIGVPVLGVLGLENEMMGWGTRPPDVEPNLPPGARFVPLEGVGHFVHIEQPRLIADLILDFLGAPPSPRSSGAQP